MLVFPLFLIYQIGVLFTLPLLNGADFLTVFLFRKVGLTTGAYLGYTAVVTVLFAIAVAVLRRKQRFDPRLDRPGADRERDLRDDHGLADHVRDDQAARDLAAAGRGGGLIATRAWARAS